jgi:peptidoglycan/LPS O-acetylase OafA/YrhL
VGVLRLFLALAVVSAHSNIFGGLKVLTGGEAVQIFFVISGFYMALILDKKYHSVGLFYSNRFLRLYPTYAVVLIGSVIWFLIVWAYTHHRPPPFWIAEANSRMPAWQWVALQFSNLTMFGLDLPSLFHWQPEQGFSFLSGDAGPTTDGAEWGGRLPWITQAWSIGTEIWFYLFAPFLVRCSTSILFVIASASCALMMFMLPIWPLTYFFFPANLWFFVSGVLLCRWYSSDYFRVPHWAGIMALVYVIIAGCVVSQIDDAVIHCVMLVLIALCIPILFKSFANKAWDVAIGNLSYPVYLSHLLIINVLEATLRIKLGSVIAIVTLVSALMLVHFAESPMDGYRQRRLA